MKLRHWLALIGLMALWACTVTIPATMLRGRYQLNPDDDPHKGRFELVVDEVKPAGAAPDAGQVAPEPVADAGQPPVAGPGPDPEPPNEMAGIVEPPCCNGSGYQPPGRTVQEQVMLRPSTGQSIQEPAFGTRVRAMPQLMRHEYSQLQAWSPDERHMLLRDLADESMVVVEAQGEMAPVMRVRGSGARWLPDGRVMSWLSGPPRIIATDLDGQTEELMRFSYPGMNNGAGHEEVSRDGRFTGALVSNDGQGRQRVLLIDLKARRAVIDRTVADVCGGAGYPDWVAPSPMGRYLVLQWATDGQGPCRGMEVYSPSTGQRVRQIHGHHHHSSLGVSDDGREYLVTYENHHPANLNHPSLVRYMLDDGQRTDLRMIPWGRMEHVSCLGPPGAPCAVSAGYEFPQNQPLQGEIYLLGQAGGLRRLAYHRSTGCGSYFAQPQASISRSGRHVAFASDWGGGCDRIGGFYIDL